MLSHIALKMEEIAPMEKKSNVGHSFPPISTLVSYTFYYVLVCVEDISALACYSYCEIEFLRVL